MKAEEATAEEATAKEVTAEREERVVLKGGVEGAGWGGLAGGAGWDGLGVAMARAAVAGEE